MWTTVVHNRGHGNRKAKTPAQPAQPRCEFPDCGKYGHTVAECWKAHPELRSRGNRALPSRPKRRNIPSRPFRFLDLPPELQNRIYEMACKDGSGTPTVKEADDKEDDDTHQFYLQIDWPSNLHLASKKTYQDSKFVRPSFNGHLRCHLGPISSFNEDVNWRKLRSRVTKITFFGFTPANMNNRNFGRDEWDRMSAFFPNVEEIDVEWTKTEYKFVPESNELTQGWKDLWKPGAHQAFLDGETDITSPEGIDAYKVDYVRAVDRLKLWYLRKEMTRKGRSCKVFSIGVLQWLGHGRKLLYIQVSYACTALDG
ncbi:hypothetical protein H2200_011599 [Cladophialophora chaetospira]|uniref:Uncharacterized protein n=1 Tax=Cladophialophora chaetospira TaxID=386627 RepID=A0AA38WZL5_9EURO|nr:hypothetical protein H2200_011599 [Cladophialophora chaetospira]